MRCTLEDAACDQLTDAPDIRKTTRNIQASLFFREAIDTVLAAPQMGLQAWEWASLETGVQPPRRSNSDGQFIAEKAHLRRKSSATGSLPAANHPKLGLIRRDRNVDVDCHSEATGRRRSRVGTTPLEHLGPGATRQLEPGRPQQGIDEQTDWQAEKRSDLTAKPVNFLYRAAIFFRRFSGPQARNSDRIFPRSSTPGEVGIQSRFRWYGACCIPGGSFPNGGGASRVRREPSTAK